MYFKAKFTVHIILQFIEEKAYLQSNEVDVLFIFIQLTPN